MKAALSFFIKHGAAFFVLEVKKHMAKHILQVLGVNAIVIFIRLKMNPTQVEGRAKHMA